VKLRVADLIDGWHVQRRRWWFWWESLVVVDHGPGARAIAVMQMNELKQKRKLCHR
jgi:hypothetical protein